MSARAWLVADPDSICNPDPVLYVILNVKILTFYVTFSDVSQLTTLLINSKKHYRLATLLVLLSFTSTCMLP